MQLNPIKVYLTTRVDNGERWLERQNGTVVHVSAETIDAAAAGSMTEELCKHLPACAVYGLQVVRRAAL